jgi:hypothetical protein
MNTETPEWHIVAVQRHYEYLDLSNEQAEQICLFEHESRNTLAGALSYSFWEEKDREWDRFRIILSPEQLVLYERERKVFIEGFESGLQKSDTAEWATEITIHEEMTGWYADTFIPAFRRDALQSSLALFSEQEKIHYLRAAYKIFLRKSRQDTLVNHYRHSRLFQPNLLRLALLRQELLRLWPEYALFWDWADAPTRGIAGFVTERYKGLCRHSADLLRQKAEEVKEQWSNVRMKHTGEPVIRGWHTTVIEERWPVEELGMMALLLMDRPEVGRPKDNRTE